MTEDAVPSQVLGVPVTFASVPPGGRADLPLVSGTDGQPAVRASSRAALLDVPGVGRFLIEEGRRIVIDAATGATATELRAWLHGTATALLAGQRGLFALHASVVELDGVRVAIAGRQRAGKSTTLLAAAQRGGRIVADDVAILEVSSAVRVVPFGRSVHVWRDTARRLGLDPGAGTPVASGLDKVALPAPEAVPCPLHAVVVLHRDEITHPQSVRLGAEAALPTLRRQTYRPRLAETLWPDSLFTWQATLARRLPVFRLTRPNTWSVDAVVDHLGALARDVGARVP